MKSGERWYQILNPLLCLIWFVPSQPQQKSQFKAARNMKMAAKTMPPFCIPRHQIRKKKREMTQQHLRPQNRFTFPNKQNPNEKTKAGENLWARLGRHLGVRNQKILPTAKNCARPKPSGENMLHCQRSLTEPAAAKMQKTDEDERHTVHVRLSGAACFLFSFLSHAKKYELVFFFLPDPVATVGIFFFPWVFFSSATETEKKKNAYQ